MNDKIGNIFPLGQVVATRGVFEYCKERNFPLIPYIVRHSNCDWGEVCKDDAKQNEKALKNGSRLMSIYRLPDRKRIWVITEAIRSATTLLFPEDY